jgi:hypothetical protein
MTFSEVKELMEYFNDKKEVKRFIESVEKGFINSDHYEYSLDDGTYFYDEEEYSMLHNGEVVHNDDCAYCEEYNKYYPADEVYPVHISYRETQYWSEDAIRSKRVYFYEGEYYYECISEFDVYWCEDLSEYMHIDYLYWHENMGEYYSYPPDNDEEYVNDYHSGSYEQKFWTKDPKYKIGFEIEKEDEDVKESINIHDFQSETDSIWRKEKDSSLSDESGFELISPTFEFNIKKIFELIRSNDVLVNHINADHSRSCGGHINLSERGLTGEQLFDKVKGYTPFLYALYYGRVNKNHCKGKSNDDLKSENNKYQAIKIHSDRIEFRIISAVPNVDTLEWRAKLIRKMLLYPTSDIKQAYFYVETKFKSLLKQTYKTDEKLNALHKRFVKFSLKFENINIK